MYGTSSFSRVKFLPVPIAKEKSVAIVATGPSFSGVRFEDLGPNVHIIAVKGAIHALKIAHSWITVDANRRCRVRQMAQPVRRHGVKYYAAVPQDYGLPGAARVSHQRPAEPGIHYLERIPGHGLAEDNTQIITGNSAFAALGLAYHMGFRRMGLFGVDGTQDLYGTGVGNRPRGDLSGLASLFQSALPQLENRGIEVRNAGLLKTWPSERPSEVIRWLNDA